MKVFAVGSIRQPLTPEQRQQIMPEEVPHTLQMYLDGTIEQFWFRENSGPIFLMSVESVDHAKETLNTLPLVAAGLMKFELMPVGPLAPLGLLIQAK